ncbi:hypothetical protein ZWY2020_038558 [Hordeum vulgare]|nr:hypothetical protein ZWY2020_038558 [Hordeum vulgare]
MARLAPSRRDVKSRVLATVRRCFHSGLELGSHTMEMPLWPMTLALSGDPPGDGALLLVERLVRRSRGRQHDEARHAEPHGHDRAVGRRQANERAV